MAQMSKWTVLIRAFFATVFAMFVATPNDAIAQTQSDASQAYRVAVQQGTVGALERFIERYPQSAEASVAFREIVLLSRGSVLAGNRPIGLDVGTAPRSVGTSGPVPY